MDGFLGAGSEVSQVQLSLIALASAVALWLALHVRRRVREDRAARRAAEAAARQADRIAQLISALAQARTTAAAVDACVHEPVHALRADAGSLFLINREGSRAEMVRAIGYGSAEQPAVLSLADKTPLSDAVGRGAPVLVESSALRAAEYSPEPREDGSLRFAAIAAVPLLVGSRVIALVQFEFEKPRAFSADDRAYFEALAVRGAQALDRTWQYEHALRARVEAETQRARADQEIAERQKVEVALRASEARGRALAARTIRLHALTAALSESLTLEDVARAVVRQGLVVAGATGAEVTLLADDAFEILYADGPGMADPRRLAREPGLCATAAVDTQEPVFVSSFEEWQERFPRSASLGADGGYVSSATVPLLVKGAAIGVLAFYFTAPVNFDDEYQALLVSVAQDCAQALDRARLYESAQKARAEAEAANRLKDEFVSIVSHELRSPLNAILGWTAILLRGDLDEPLAGRALQSVHENATRQARLIEELLDFSRVASGRLALAREEIEIRHLLRAVVESQIPESVARGVALELEPLPRVTVSADVPRLEQVFFNLLGNALKFTPAGGRVTIGVSSREDAVDVRVTDTGRGLDPALLPHVFERFRQGEGASREHGGLGLGLSIARQIVEAHQGSISVESAGEGHGSTFIVTLPICSTGRAEAGLSFRGQAPADVRPGPGTNGTLRSLSDVSAGAANEVRLI